MGLDRRTFLQKAGLGLAALGVSETALSLLGAKSLAVPALDRYFQALAQPGVRKLALLVGINQYPRSTALNGCLTDVELQQELLINRFGVKASDILVLTNSQASRENIEEAFVEHLSEQASTGDVVLFHFSGYGSQVKIAQESDTNRPANIQKTLVPVDGILPNKGIPATNDLLEETLVLLMRTLATDHVTTVLDTSHRQASKLLQGNLRVRSCPNPPAEAPSKGELAFQEQIRRRLKDAGRQWSNSPTLNQMPGVVLAAAGSNQMATETNWDGFSAGLFTYALTQYLWQALPATTVQISLSRTASTVNQLVGKEQQPRLMGEKRLNPLLAYYLPPDPSMGADGVVTAVEEKGKTTKLWLAGLPAQVLEYYQANSIVQVVGANLPRSGSQELKVGSSELPLSQDSDEQASNSQASTKDQSLQLQIRSREGLRAKARVVDDPATESYPIRVGQLLQEAIRVLPRNLGLAIALDLDLQRIERVDATSAFANIPSVSSVVIAGEQSADYMFGKVSKSQSTAQVSEDSAANSKKTSDSGSKSETETKGYGLLSLANEPIPNTAGEVGEAVKSATNRLTPQLETLLAAKLLRLTANEGSSRLGVRASLEVVEPKRQPVMQRSTWRALTSRQPCPPFCNPPKEQDGKIASGFSLDKKSNQNLILPGSEGSISTVPIGSRIQYRLENYSSDPVYFILLGFESSSNAIALYKSKYTNQPLLKDGALPSGASLTIPKPSAAFDWLIRGSAGLWEIQLICSSAPFTKTSMALEASGLPVGDEDRVDDLNQPLEVAQAVLEDLHQASANLSNPLGTVSDAYALDVNAWATLSFIYQVV
ncbi:MAG: DUF4384 domain-containing protein [Merismopedia sp. SIO2A8]|nr:DUF4384 domain-containing protein [Symploca sp. SIO2B6]NET50216.1 DUF4384 domain-containing protein [Merismopedia sp. SIO2A8]